MDFIKLDVSKVYDFVEKTTIDGLKDQAEAANRKLDDKTGKGNDFLGWINLPSSITPAELSDIDETAKRIKPEVDIVVVIGIGGSYLGTKAVAEAGSDSFAHLKGKSKAPALLFAGQNIGEDYLTELLELLDQRKYAIVVISKGQRVGLSIALFIHALTQIIYVVDKMKSAIAR